MLPNALTPLIVAATLALATAIIDVAGLGFLGLGPPDPRTPEWGDDADRFDRGFLRSAPWLIFFPGHRHRHQRDRLQPPGRRPARVARPAAEAMTTPVGVDATTATAADRGDGPEPLLSVRDLVVRFRTHDGTIHAVNGDRLRSRARGRDARARRRVRLRQERDEPGDHAPAAQAGRADRGRPDHVRRAGPASLSRERDARPARPRHRDDLPGPDDQPEPGPDHRGADGRDDPGASEGRPRRTRATAGDRAAEHGRHPRARRRGSRATRTSSPAACASA